MITLRVYTSSFLSSIRRSPYVDQTIKKDKQNIQITKKVHTLYPNRNNKSEILNQPFN